MSASIFAVSHEPSFGRTESQFPAAQLSKFAATRPQFSDDRGSLSLQSTVRSFPLSGSIFQRGRARVAPLEICECLRLEDFQLLAGELERKTVFLAGSKRRTHSWRLRRD